MAIDHIIDYDCIPKQQLGTHGILDRLKGQERAQQMIHVFRQHGDDRPPAEMGFEFIRNTPEGEEERQIIVVQDLLDAAEELQPLENHCVGCPANRTGKPFGCMSFIQYPISSKAESWMMDSLPVPDDTLVWSMLKMGIDEFGYDGDSIRVLREARDEEENTPIYFEEETAQTRRLGALKITGDQMFEMLFNVGQHIIPNHGAILLLFFHAIRRDLESNEITSIAPANENSVNKYPFRLAVSPVDDSSIADMKDFFHALYVAWLLDVRVIVDS